MFEMIFRIPKKIGFMVVAISLIVIFPVTLAFGRQSFPGIYFIPIILTSIIFESRQAYIVVLLSFFSCLIVDLRLIHDVTFLTTKIVTYTLTFNIVFFVGKELKRYISLIQQKSNIIQGMNRDIVFAFVQAIEAKDPYLNNHSRNVSYYARELALNMRLPEDEVNNIYWSGVLHDIGKIGVSENILNKESKLSDTDWQQIKKHPETGAEILKLISSFEQLVPNVLYHHQYYNGKGYPGDLSEDEIPIGARILAVVDAYDAMTSNRVYRQSLSKEEAIGELLKCAGEQFDPVIIREFVRLLEKPNGLKITNAVA